MMQLPSLLSCFHSLTDITHPNINLFVLEFYFACSIFNHTVCGHTATVTVVWQCVCVSVTRANGFELLYSANMALVPSHQTIVDGNKISVLLKNTAKRSVKRRKSFKCLKNLWKKVHFQWRLENSILGDWAHKVFSKSFSSINWKCKGSQHKEQ